MGCTIKDIAEKAGVSKTTVSFAFNYPERIAPETFRRIMDITREMDYSPNPVARILMLKKTDIIAVTLPVPLEILGNREDIAALMAGIGMVCEQESRSMAILAPCGRSADKYITTAIVDGFIALEPKEEVIAALKIRNIPYCLIYRDNEPFKEIRSPYERGKAAAEHLFRILSDQAESLNRA